MEAIYIEAQASTPKVIMDKENNRFEIMGQSLPENVSHFYGPVLEWIDEYVVNPNEKTNLVMRMDYYNTASSKMLFEILSKFNKLYESGKEVSIEWHYADDDEDMEEAGEEYADLLAVPFTFKDYIAED